MDADAAAFAVESIRRWWCRLGKARYPEAKRLVITADRGGSNGVRVRLWERELQRFADETGLVATVAPLPPGTSEWNRIEHRLSAHISRNWRGKPLVGHQFVVQPIGATTTQTGLTVSCEIDASRYPKGIKAHRRLTEELGQGRQVTFDDRELGELRYMTRYGSGGFQGRLKRAFRRPLRDLPGDTLDL